MDKNTVGYPIKDIPVDTWYRFKNKCNDNHMTIKQAIDYLIDAVVSGKIKLEKAQS